MQNKKEELKDELLRIKKCVEEALEAVEKGEEEKAQELLRKGLAAVPVASLVVMPHEHRTEPTKIPEGSRIIEGVFDGQHMMGGDGRQYLVPPNYSSKSKLVEGDLLKLAITSDGAFVYKQIGPIGRKRVICKLEQDGSGMWSATDGVHRWKLVTAAVSFFRGSLGDEVVILIPSDAPSKWAAVENIINR